MNDTTAKLDLRAARDCKAVFEAAYKEDGLWTRECAVWTMWDALRQAADQEVAAAEEALRQAQKGATK